MEVRKKLLSSVTAFGLGITAVTGALPIRQVSEQFTADAADVSYPVQEFRLGMADTDNNVSASGSSLVPSELTGTSNEKWSLNYVSSGVYEIVNSSNGQILTASGSSVTLASDTNAANQR